METLLSDSQKNQELTSPERKVGVEIVTSANLAKRFFHGPSRFHGQAILGSDDDWRRRLERAIHQ